MLAGGFYDDVALDLYNVPFTMQVQLAGSVSVCREREIKAALTQRSQRTPQSLTSNPLVTTQLHLVVEHMQCCSLLQQTHYLLFTIKMFILYANFFFFNKTDFSLGDGQG